MTAAGTASPPAGRVAGRLQTIVVIVMSVIVLGTLAYVASGPGAADALTQVELTGDTSGKIPVPGDVPPAFSAVDYNGAPVSLADYAGKPVWLTFGASWCPDCRTEAPDVQAMYEANRDKGLVVLGVFINETASEVAQYADRAGLTFPIAVDPNADIAAAYRSMGIPTHFFIGSDGKVREVRIGALSSDDMARAVAAIMN